METLKTFDYGQFKTITSNREVDNTHVNRLVKAIRNKNLLHLNPIICNESLEVIDGQHRLEAVNLIGGIYLYYIIDPNISKTDIATINSNSKNWTLVDYINYWTIEKRPGFDKLSSFLSENPLIPNSTAIMMLSASNRKNLVDIRNGFVDVTNYNFAKRVAGILKEYRNYVEHAYDRNFVLAVIDCCTTPTYDHDLMKQKLEYQSRSLVRCINKKQYLEVFEEIYNYKNQKARLRFT